MAVKQNEAFLALYQAQARSSDLKETYAFLEGDRGYFITGDISPVKAMEVLAAWQPYVTFELHQTVKFPKPIETGLAVAKQRAAMMK